MQVIIYAHEGGVAIVRPTEEALTKLSIETIATKDVPVGVPFDIVDASAIPADRTFRNAWEKKGAGVVHNIPKARLIAHEKRRVMRASEFAPLDIEATIPTKAVAAEEARQIIRDKYTVMQQQIDAATSVEALKNALGLSA